MSNAIVTNYFITFLQNVDVTIFFLIQDRIFTPV